MSSFIKNYNYPGYENLSDTFNISAATSFPSSPNTTIVSCSGQVGNHDPYDPDASNSAHSEQFSGSHTAQFTAALQNVEKALAAAQPTLSKKELWDGVFSITSYHVGLMGQGDQSEMAEVAKVVLGRNRPAWSAIKVVGLLPEGCVVEVVVQAAYKGGE